MPRVAIVRPDGWLTEGAPLGWPRPPDPHPQVALVAWGRIRGRWTAGYLTWTDCDSWMARSRGGLLSATVLYTRWVPAGRLQPRPGLDYRGVLRVELHGPASGWPVPAVGPDGSPWYGQHRAYPAVPVLEGDR